MSDKKLAGRTAVISGASKGLGKAMAVALARAGASVALISRNKEQLQACAKEIKDAGSRAEFFQADVTDESQVARVEKAVSSAFGKVQILINNAGMNLRKQLTDFTLDEWRQVVDTNLTSAFLMSRAFVPQMKGQGYGRIINLTSIMSHVAIAGRTAYCSSKAGLLGFTRALALELVSEKITVNGISPGPFATELNRPILDNPELNQQFISKIPVGRWGQPQEIGDIAVFLCSEEAGFITGTDILVDGGWTAQ
jgi:NAD(P)-dependent dehydrogenase (short-subunit alcohol dehydrogenase family)